MATINGDGGSNILTGTSVRDTIDGLGGNDIIDAGDGNDIVKGGEGDDTVTGGAGNDTLVGGGGTDTAVYLAAVQAASAGAAPMGVFVGALLQINTGGAEGTDTLNGFERLIFDGVQFDIQGSNVVARLGADSQSIQEDAGTVTGNVLDNDYDVDGSLSVLDIRHGLTDGSVGAPIAGDCGVLTIQANGSYSYTPGANAFGTDVFTYVVVDGGVQKTVTLTFNVAAVNDATTAQDSSNSGAEDTVISGAVTATDNDGPATFTVLTGPSNGVLLLNPDGTYTYTPNANFHGTDSFTFTASEGSGSDTGEVSLTVSAVSDNFTVGAGGDFATIQEAVDAAEDGDVITILAGTYREQVLVDGKTLTIVGNDGAILESPDLANITSSGGYYSTLTAINGANLTVENLTIDGRQQGHISTGSQTNAGVAFIDSDGSFTGGHISNYGEAVFAGQQQGYGVIIRSLGNAHTVEISDTVIENFQKNGIDARGANLVVDLNGNTISGYGSTTLIAQNGIVLVGAVSGIIDGNTISDIGYTGINPARATGILLHSGAHGVTVTDNTLNLSTDNVSGIHLVSSDAGVITGNAVSDATSGIAQEGTFNFPVSTAGDNSYTGVVYQLDFYPNEAGTDVWAMEGTSGDDYLGGAAESDLLDGGEGNDELFGFGEADLLAGAAGHDTIDGGDGDDTVDGGDGDDTIDGGAGDDIVFAGEGNDDVSGGAGFDLVSYSNDLDLEDFSDASGSIAINAGSEGTDTLDGVELVLDGEGQLFWLVSAGGSIQAAIDAANPGDTILIASGTYAENLTVSTDDLTIIGLGEVTIQGTFKSDNGIADGQVDNWLQTRTQGEGGYTGVAGNGLTISADGLSVSNLNFNGFLAGVQVNTSTGATLTDIDITDSVIGYYKDADDTIVDMSIIGGSVTEGNEGLDFAKANSADGGVTGLLIDGLTLTNLNSKGLYFEALANSTITGVTAVNVGAFGRVPTFGGNGQAGTGIELNLKYGVYGNVTITDFVFTDVGNSSGGGLNNSAGGGAIHIKLRDQGSYASSPATWTGGAVQISNGSIDGTSTGVHVGEPGQNVAGPPVEVSNVTVDNAAFNAFHGDLANLTTSDVVFTATDGADDLTIDPQSTGDIELNLGDGADTVNGGTATSDLTIDGGDGEDSLTGGAGEDTIDGGADNDTLSGGSGADSLTGGEGDDAIAGGGGQDTAHYTADLDLADFDGSTGTFTLDAGAEGTDSLSGVERVVDGGGQVFWLVDAGASIQAAINASSAGDTILIAAGTYDENVVVNKDGLTIVGHGDVTIHGTFKSMNGLAEGDSVATWLQTRTQAQGGYSPAPGVGLTVNADNVSISNINIDSFVHGVEFGDGVSNVTFTDVDITDTVRGYYKTEVADIDHVTISGGSISDGVAGIMILKAMGPGTAGDGLAEYITVDGVSFSNLNEKGIYAEALSHSVISDVEMDNVGVFGRVPTGGGTVGGTGTGIELNLKNGVYQDVVITGFTLTDVGTSTGGGAPHAGAGAIHLKLRDDAPSYSGTPATWVGDAVEVSNGSIDGTSTGIHVGEPGKTVAGPPVDIVNVTIDNAVFSSVHGDVANLTTSDLHFTGTDGDDELTIDPHSTGDIELDLGDGADTLNGGTSTSDLNIDGGAGDDSLTGGAGDDAIVGGEGNDTIDGGAGFDSATYSAPLTAGDFGFAGGVITLNAGADGNDTLTNVERVDQGKGNTFWLVESGDSIQAAINNAAEGDTIVIAQGTYLENLTLNGKALNFVGVGDVTITAAGPGSTILVDGDFGGGSVSFSNLTITGSNTGIITAGIYVGGENLADVSVDDCVFTDNDYVGFYIYEADIDQLSITNSTFTENGETGLNSGGHIKLVDLKGDALLQNLVLEGQSGGPDVSNSPDRPDYGIEIHGTENAKLTTSDTSPIGNVVIDNVVISGDFHKSAFAINNFQNLNDLTITDLDLSGATADWSGTTTSVMNVDGIRESYNASTWDVALPNQTRATSLRGEHSTETPAGQTVTGTSSSDQIWGATGDDQLIGGLGDDLITGDAGTDIVVLSGASTSASAVQNGAVLTVTSASGVDVLTTVEYVEFADRTITVNNGNAVLIDDNDTASVNENASVGGNVLSNVFDLDADTIAVTAVLDPNGVAATANGSGTFVVQGNHGFLSLNPNGSFTYNATDDSLAGGQVVTETFTYTSSDGGDTRVRTLTITVTGQAEAIFGTNAANTLNGTNADDQILGLGGNDVINGMDGNDELYGGSGADSINGGTGADLMYGDSGNDTYYVDNAGDVVVEDDGGGTDFVVTALAYTLTDYVENLTQQGSDNIAGTGNAQVNTLNGNSGNNTLFGMAGNDILRGNDGADVLIGGVGNDQLYGNAGADRFVVLQESILTSGTREADTIRDFNHLEGDRLDLSAIDANQNVLGDQAFTFFSAFTGVAGQATMLYSGGSTILRFDVNGDSQYDLQVTVMGDHRTVPVLTGGEPDSAGGWIL